MHVIFYCYFQIYMISVSLCNQGTIYGLAIFVITFFFITFEFSVQIQQNSAHLSLRATSFQAKKFVLAFLYQLS